MASLPILNMLFLSSLILDPNIVKNTASMRNSYTNYAVSFITYSRPKRC